jgi:hypothetical protein
MLRGFMHVLVLFSTKEQVFTRLLSILLLHGHEEQTLSCTFPLGPSQVGLGLFWSFTKQHW